MVPADISGVVPISMMAGDSPEETALLRELHESAREFLLGQKWCFGVGEEFFGAGLGGVIGVFLMQLIARLDRVDEWVWVIVGDAPPAYLVFDNCLTAMAALQTYIDLMREWVSLAREGKSSPEAIPVNAPATPENASKLELRLNALQDHILPWLKEEPVQ